MQQSKFIMNRKKIEGLLNWTTIITKCDVEKLR